MPKNYTKEELENGRWVTVKGHRVFIKDGEDIQDTFDRAMNKRPKKKETQSEKTIEEYGLTHRPGNLLEYSDEVASGDKIANGDYFPKDILTHPRDYFPDYGNFKGTEKLLALYKKMQGNPEMEVTIYRGSPSGGVLNTGDWVTLSEEYAKDYAAGGNYADNPNSKVHSYKAKAKELSFDGDSFYEMGYWGKKQKV